MRSSSTMLEPARDFSRLKAENQPLKSNMKEAAQLNDKGIRLICIPAFGILIPNLTGLFGHLRPDSPLYWLGYVWFTLISFLIWHGNRFFLLKQREHYDWFDHPIRKVIFLLSANVFYTAPLAVVMLLGWYSFAGFPAPDWDAIRLATLMCVVCVIFITHIYETVYLIRQRESDLLAFEKLERSKAQAELEALKSQIDPHFMFNSLNTLSFLIERDEEKARAFTEHLADVYRYILLNKNRELVLLRDEIEFLNHYYALLRLRFGDAIRVTLPADPGELDGFLLPPISLQLLLENAVKHNELSDEAPLHVRLEIGHGRIAVRNEIRNLRNSRPSAKVGLKNLDERCRLILKQGIQILNTGESFTVELPLLRAAQG